MLAGLDAPDDAGVFRIDDERALVQTVDYFTPVVDDPVDFGRIAAANSLSDVYAMGATPLTALNIVCFPEGRLPMKVLSEIIRGSCCVLNEAGVQLLGGHTVDDDELKFGLAVTGMVHPDRLVRTGGAIPGDVLFLTKPIGIGVITTAIKRDMVSKEAVARAVEVMTQLNRRASEVMVEVGVSAATDVTGFGLLGHAAEMADASGCTLEISDGAVPVLAEALELAEQDVFPGGSRANLRHLTETGAVSFHDGIPGHRRLLLADAVTSGGLLIACPAKRSHRLESRLAAVGIEPAVIGQVTERKDSLSIHVSS